MNVASMRMTRSMMFVDVTPEDLCGNACHGEAVHVRAPAEDPRAMAVALEDPTLAHEDGGSVIR